MLLVEVDARASGRAGDTTTRSVPLMMKVPLSVIIGKSPMKTVWLLISPVVLLVNSAVTNSGAAYVMSLSLHSSIGGLDLVEARVGEGQRHRAGEVLDRRDLGRGSPRDRRPGSRRRRRCDAGPRLVADQPLERLGLQVEQVGNLEGLGIFAKETRVGAPGAPGGPRWSRGSWWRGTMPRCVLPRTTLSSGGHRDPRATVVRLARPRNPGGRREVAGPACSPSVVDARLSTRFPGTRRSTRQARNPHTRAQTWTRAAQRGSLAANAAAVERGLLDDHASCTQGTIET